MHFGGQCEAQVLCCMQCVRSFTRRPDGRCAACFPARVVLFSQCDSLCTVHSTAATCSASSQTCICGRAGCSTWCNCSSPTLIPCAIRQTHHALRGLTITHYMAQSTPGTAATPCAALDAAVQTICAFLAHADALHGTTHLSTFEKQSLSNGTMPYDMQIWGQYSQ
jgi:hypothetical protein